MITDRQGNTVTLSSEVLAISASEEPTPVVTLRLDNVSGEQPLDVDFSARVKHASRIGVSSWAWDFDGDGQVDSTSPDEASFSFEEPGIYFPRLEVVAEDGSVGFAIVQVEVLASAELLVSSNTLDPLQGETADFVLSLGGALQAKLDIVDSQKRVVRNLTDLQRLPAGDNRLTWDGKDNAGQVLPPGAYSPVVSFINGEEMEELSLSDETVMRISHRQRFFGTSLWQKVRIKSPGSVKVLTENFCPYGKPMATYPPSSALLTRRRR